ncbi:MAG: type II toxin-antitoxin system HigB family toxin [Heteroscytonema crispum UTEX LB 1556]
MHVISRSRLVEFWEKHPNAETSLRSWYKITSLAEWQSFVDLRQVFPSADQVSNLIVFNIGGNNYRLIALVDYKYQKVFIRHVLTHAEYDKEDWKNDPWHA